jgi:dimethylamine corrinoid protein
MFPLTSFVRSVADNGAEVLGISALMTTTIQEQKKIIDLLTEQGLREKVKVIVGGAPLSEEWALKDWGRCVCSGCHSGSEEN